jgi:hypothetical protein
LTSSRMCRPAGPADRGAAGQAEKAPRRADALSDVRAKAVKVKNVAKVQEVLAPTTVTRSRNAVGDDQRHTCVNDLAR